QRARLRIPWMPMLISAAAGFLLALLLFRPWEKPPAPEQPPDKQQEFADVNEQYKEMLLLAVATAPVQGMAPNSHLRQKVRICGEIVVGCRVRTGPTARCEFQTKDGSEVRLNTDPELVFHSSRQLELGKGRMMAKVKSAPVPFQATIPQAVVTA